MDVDAFARTHSAEWDRLAVLTHTRRLSGAEATELVDLYQRTSAHLSMVRSSAPDPALVGRLTQLVAQARARVTGSHPAMWTEVLTFFRVGFPAAVWRARWWWIAAGIGFVIVGLLVGAWVAGDPAVQAALGTPEAIRQLVDEDFAAYYSSDAAAGFAAQVWTNNAWVSALVLIAGAFFVLPAVYVLAQNAINVGIVGGLMVANGRGDVFFGLIAPHGLLELTAVFIAAGAGMRVGWQWFDPGPRPRSVALAEEGRAAVAIAMGLAVVLLVSGIIEGFVTPSGLPTWAGIGIGALALAAFLAYVAVYGRRAERAGYIGDITSDGGVTELAPMSG
ncbi:MAG: stage II sporulation protein M [Actinomycetota bacterium]|nr:stage II sporulation protein M [Actinomycetota bacterium]